VATCRAIEAASGADFLEDIYGSFGGCVAAFTGRASGVADIAHGCEFQVERGFFPSRGACVQAFKGL
jgi:hypothetical protein